tara:strand:- start:146 stop:772 length:627 start_codon:yes stop_codon:yes gene_type:complete
MTYQKNKTNKQLEKEFSERFEKTEEKLTDISQTNDRILQALEGMTAQDRPTGSTHVETDASAVDLGPPVIMTVDESGVEPKLVVTDIGNTDPTSQEFKDKHDALLFDEEMVTIRIGDTAERNADRVFTVSVNGISRTFVRGQVFTIPRMFVGVLAGAKPVHYGNVEYDDQRGVGVDHPARRGLRYGFEVLKDDNPRGAKWLEERLKAA